MRKVWSVSVYILVVCAGVGHLRAANDGKDRFVEAAKKLMDAINRGDVPAIENMMDAQMQQLLPPDKAKPFFGGITSAGGKLKDVGEPTIDGPTATIKISGERLAWNFKISLDATDKISGLLITPGGKPTLPVKGDRFSRTAKRLISAINGEHFSTVESMMSAEMQKQVPLDKTTTFLRSLAATTGKLKETGPPSVDGSTATLHVPAEHGALDIKFTLDSADKISELHITPAAGAAGPPTAAAAGGDRFTKVMKKLVDAINGEDFATIEGMFDATMQQGMPLDTSKAFFRKLVEGTGKLKEVGDPKITGPTAVITVTAERGALDFTITLDESGKLSGLYVKPAAASTEGEAVPRSHTSMRLPFRGEWTVFWGGDNETVNYHVRTRGQRRAADIVIMDDHNVSHKGSGQQNDDYYAYGKEILAAGAGKVVTAIDGVPDNVPGSMNSLCAVGNCLIIDQGQNEFALYVHLQPGSERVHRGDEVQQGQVLGLCGNSGNSSEPHLHFHVQDKAVLQDGAGITPYFTGVKCRRGDATLSDAEYTFLKGDRIESTAK